MMGDFITKSDENGTIILTNLQAAINKKTTVKKAMDKAQKELVALAKKTVVCYRTAKFSLSRQLGLVK
ncbi:MAG: hypothetical protein WDO06_01495 [Actinomycetota bacterium]